MTTTDRRHAGDPLEPTAGPRAPEPTCALPVVGREEGGREHLVEQGGRSQVRVISERDLGVLAELLERSTFELTRSPGTRSSSRKPGIVVGPRARCRAIALIVQHWLRSAVASTVLGISVG